MRILVPSRLHLTFVARRCRPQYTARNMSSPPIAVTPLETPKRQKGDHWLDDSGKGFRNPWPSYQDRSGWAMAKFAYQVLSAPKHPELDSPITALKPTFGTPADYQRIKSTWLGHAAFLLELPSTRSSAPASSSSRGLTFLCDPVFSQRCSPSQSIGPAPRITREISSPEDFAAESYSLKFLAPAANVSELPELDAIIISHNHYDHCDLPTLRDVYHKHADRPPFIFIPLANRHTLKGTVPEDRIIEMDWWEEKIIEVEGKGRARVTCTPCQHFCARTPFDKNHALWSSWAIQGLDEEGKVKGSIWFGGDTGYCATPHEDHRLDESLPVCPAFKEIGKRVGPFDLALIPIGAYAPRYAMSPIHNAPIDAVRMFRDIKAKRAVGMHWGTWKMAADPVNEPPVKLAEARGVVGLSEEEFGVTGLGETRTYEVD